MLCVIFAWVFVNCYAQNFTTVRAGKWSSPSTWANSIVPDAANSSTITLNHAVEIVSDTAFTIDGVVVNGILTISSGAFVDISSAQGLNGLSINSGSLLVYGTLACKNGTELSGTTLSNTYFYNGSLYRHQTTNEGTVPLATWDVDATFSIEGFEGNLTMQSPNWSQAFGNLVYNCAAQGEFINFKGLLKSIRGSLIIQNTHSFILQLAAASNMTLSVGKNIEVYGPSEVWFGATKPVSISVDGDFILKPSGTGTSYTSTIGSTSLTIHGNLEMDANSKLKLASGTGIGHTDVYLHGNLDVQRGVIDALGTGSGALIFSGENQLVRIVPSLALQGTIDYIITKNSKVDINSSVLSNTIGGNLVVNGTLALGSVNPQGVLGTQVQIAGTIQFGDEGTLLLKGEARQYLEGSVSLRHLQIQNEEGVTLLGNLSLTGDLNILSGNLACNNYSLEAGGNIFHGVSGGLSGVRDVVLSGQNDQSISLGGLAISNLIVNNSNHMIDLHEPLRITEAMTFQSSNTSFQSNGFLTMLSTPERTASIGKLEQNNVVAGNVTIQRYIKTIGERYRYISSPVATTVADLKDNMPVSGSFADPSTGPGIISNAASLYYYQETTLPGSRGWKGYPTSGNASDNELIKGLGYSFYAWYGSQDILLDFKGPIHQGDVDLPVTYSSGIVTSDDGWNLVGNPYPSAIQWSEGSGITSLRMNASIAIRDNTIFGYQYWDGELGGIPNGVIASGQSFWVKADAEDPVLQLHESAKVSEDGEFFRKHKDIDYITLNLSRSGVTDKAYFRLREGAKEGIDQFDIEKFQNDFFTVSLVDHNMKLAIHAIGQASCHLEIPIHLVVNDKKPGEWNFSVNAFGQFGGAKIMLRDNLLDIEVDLIKDYVFSTHDAVQSISDRFVLIIDAVTPNPVSSVIPDFVCTNDSLVVQLQSGQSGVHYYLEGNLHDQIYPDRITDTALIFAADNFHSDEQRYRLIGSSFCMNQQLSDDFTIRKVAPSVVQPKVTPVCQQGNVVIEILPSKNHSVYRWYETNNLDDVIFEGSRFVTELLTKSKVYYVTEMDERGCSSDLIPVTAKVVKYDSAQIIYEDDIFYSNYQEDNEWYYNGKSTGVNTSFFVPSEPGVYGLTVAVEGCQTSDSYPYLVTQIYSGQLSKIICSPNPVAGIFTIKSASDDPIEISGILALNGVSVAYLCEWRYLDSNEVIIATDRLSSGMYIVTIKTIERQKNFRIIKK